MSSKRATSKQFFRAALKEAEESLMKRPNVVGVGIVRSPSGSGYRVALYVSSMPDSTQAQEVLHAPIELPDAGEQIEVDVRAIGVVDHEKFDIDEGEGGISKETR